MRLVRILLIVGVVVGAANFIALSIGEDALGGNAINGKVEGGRFYVGSHGKFTEVTRRQFEHSRWHCRSVWFTHPLAMFCMLALYGLQSQAKADRESRTA